MVNGNEISLIQEFVIPDYLAVKKSCNFLREWNFLDADQKKYAMIFFCFNKNIHKNDFLS